MALTKIILAAVAVGSAIALAGPAVASPINTGHLVTWQQANRLEQRGWSCAPVGAVLHHHASLYHCAPHDRRPPTNPYPL